MSYDKDVLCLVIAYSKKFECLYFSGKHSKVLSCFLVCGRSGVRIPDRPCVQTVRHRFNIYASSCVALVLWRGVGHYKLVTRFIILRV